MRYSISIKMYEIQGLILNGREARVVKRAFKIKQPLSNFLIKGTEKPLKVTATASPKLK